MDECSHRPARHQESPVSFGSLQDAKERIRQSVDIIDLIGGYLELRRQGRGYVAHCPWHDDSRPSLQVNAERQSWKCWVCNIGGDIFSFVMQREGVSFPEALDLLADRAGIALPNKRREGVVAPGSPDDKRTLYQAAAWAEEQFHDCLLHAPIAEPARRYLNERGISAESIATFRLGFSPDEWQWLTDRARGTPFTPAVLEAVGLLGRSDKTGRTYDRFKGRAIFPIRDTQLRPIGFGGRVLPGLGQEHAAKYINSPETRLFSKSDQLYGLDVARDAISRTRKIVVVEGYTDVIMAHQHGLRNVVAVLGTALNERHLRLLRRFGDTVILLLDGDEAGQRRTNEILGLFVAAQMDLRILTLPEEFDPCEFLLEQGGPALQALVDQAIDALEHKLVTATSGIDLAHDTHRAHQALEQILSTLAKVPASGADAGQRIREHQMLTRVARQFLLPEPELRSRLAELRRALPGPSTSSAGPHESHHSPRKTREEFPPREREVLELLVLHPELVRSATAVIAPSQLTYGRARAIFEVIDRLATEGETPEFSRVMTEIDAPELKNLLVTLEEQASAKETHAAEPAAARLARLQRDFQRLSGEPERREKLAALEARKFNEEEEQQVLLHLLAQERARHGLSSPMEG